MRQFYCLILGLKVGFITRSKTDLSAVRQSAKHNVVLSIPTARTDNIVTTGLLTGTRSLTVDPAVRSQNSGEQTTSVPVGGITPFTVTNHKGSSIRCV